MLGWFSVTPAGSLHARTGQPFFGELFRKGLDGNLASEFLIPGTPHVTHATLAEGGDDLIVAKLRAKFHRLGVLERFVKNSVNDTKGGSWGQSNNHPVG